MGKPIKFSILFPIDKLEERVIGVLERIHAQEIEGAELEVLILDTGLSSSALEQLEARPDLFAVFVKGSEKNARDSISGAGLRRATGDYALFQETDVDPAPADYRVLLKPILEFDADVVMGTRFKGAKVTKIDRFWRKTGDRAITLLFNLLNNTSLTDIFNTNLVFRRDLVAADDLRSTGVARHAEILSKAIRGSRICYEVPANYSRLAESGNHDTDRFRFVSAAWVIIRHRLFGTAP